VLRAVQVVLEEGLARPILVGRPEVIEARISASGCACGRGPTSS
jgi:malate dehydrogenase (oxaloacetate-decarboxylating)(NADP+)